MKVRRVDPGLVEKELVRRESEDLAANFKAFAEAAWTIVEPGTSFIPGLHVDAICEHLQAVAEGKILKLLINVPPRHSKSLLTSVLFNAWWWTREPQGRFLSGSYALALATMDSVRTRRVVTSKWYMDRWPRVVIQDDQAQKQYFANTASGQRQVTSVGGTTTGLGADAALLLDDPISAQQAESAIMRQQCLQWYRESFSTRSNTAKTARIVIMQRLHHQDLSGYLLREEGNDWDHLLLPMEYAGAKKKTSIGWEDPRTKEGELLWPLRYTNNEVASLKKTLGSVAYAGQMAQNPIPRGGATFRTEWIRFWYREGEGVPDPFVLQKSNGEMMEVPQRPLPKIDDNTKVASFDLSFKGGADNDYVVGQVWGTAPGARSIFYMLDQIRGRFDFVATVAAIRQLLDREPANVVLVEDKANGSAVISALKSEIPGIVPINPQGGKESRASACAPLFEAGQVWLPHPTHSPWVEDYIQELVQFPRGTHDDQVDATSQCLARMREKRIDDIAEDAFMVDSHRRLSPWSGL